MLGSSGAEPVSANAIGLPAKRRDAWPDDRVDELCRLRNAGLSFGKIAAEMGLTRGKVAGQLARLVDAGDERLACRGERLTCVDCGASITRYSLGRCPRCAPKAARTETAMPIPDDFAERATLMTQRQMKAHYHVASGTISRWAKAAGIVKPGGRKGLPADFASVAPHATMQQLKVHYGVGHDVIKRRCAETGVQPRQPATIVFNRNRFAPIKAHRDCSQAGQAAEFLQHFGPVYRCWPSGAAHKKGTHWSRNGFVLTDEELIARAERLGWDPQAWRRVA